MDGGVFVQASNHHQNLEIVKKQYKHLYMYTPSLSQLELVAKLTRKREREREKESKNKKSNKDIISSPNLSILNL
jgi:hypothetical protein